MSTLRRLPDGRAARYEAQRLIALAVGLLDKNQDQIAHDHLGLALSAFEEPLIDRGGSVDAVLSQNESRPGQMIREY